MAITLYRELKGSEFLRRLENWHSSFAWPQRYNKDIRFVGAPSPKDIADAAFGRRIDPKLSKSTVNRILPCIVDGSPMPRDLVRSVCIRAGTGRAGLKSRNGSRSWVSRADYSEAHTKKGDIPWRSKRKEEPETTSMDDFWR